MATDNRLRATVDPAQDEHLSSLEDERDLKRTEAERLVVEEGLESLGYVERPTQAHELLLWYVRRIGLILGFAGLILLGYGIFGPRTYSFMGFGITLSGFLLVLLEGLLDAYTQANLVSGNE